MSFNKKTWKDTIAEYPNRRTLTDVTSGNTQTVTVTRSVGTVSQEGDAWNAENMNDMENRIGDEFDALNSNLTELDTRVDALENGETYSSDEVAVSKWIDGKTIYRKCYEFSGYSGNKVLDSSIKPTTIDKLIKLNGCFRSTSGSLKGTYDLSTSDRFGLSIGTNGLQVLYNDGSYTASGTVIIEYTKLGG